MINQRCRRIVRVFKWVTSEELVLEKVWQALKPVRGLESGRTTARETDPVGPVADDVVQATLPFLTVPVQAMVQLQRLTGCRPGEACSMRACDIDTTGMIWLYKPPHHKTAHKGKPRVIAIGPRAQKIVEPFLKLDIQAFLFSPREAVEIHRAKIRTARKTKVQPSQVNRRKRKPKRAPGERYTSRSYCKAIAAACKRADIPRWHPHQLRHAHATEVRRRFGLEAAQVALGHSQANVTEVYAERDQALAIRVAKEIG